MSTNPRNRHIHIYPYKITAQWPLPVYNDRWEGTISCPVITLGINSWFSFRRSIQQTSAVQCRSWIRSADLQSSNMVLKWLDECAFEQRFMVFENSHWKLIFSPKKLFMEILMGLTFLNTSNYLKSALLYSDLVSVFGICSRFLHFIGIW